jgi:uncharacterized membrane protein
MHTLYVFSVFLHILAAIVWIGGALFLVFVLVPVIRRPELRQHAPVLLTLSGKRFKAVGWGTLVVLVITGLINLHCRGMLATMAAPEFWDTSMGQVLALKLVLVTLILTMSVVHDFYVGPKAVQLMREAPDSDQTKRFRAAASWMGRINVLLGLVVVLLGVMLVRGVPVMG